MVPPMRDAAPECATALECVHSARHQDATNALLLYFGILSFGLHKIANGRAHTQPSISEQESRSLTEVE